LVSLSASVPDLQLQEREHIQLEVERAVLISEGNADLVPVRFVFAAIFFNGKDAEWLIAVRHISSSCE
jgi:hypothetical protein